MNAEDKEVAAFQKRYMKPANPLTEEKLDVAYERNLKRFKENIQAIQRAEDRVIEMRSACLPERYKLRPFEYTLLRAVLLLDD